MMEIFAYDYDDSGKLIRAIQGRGALRRFKKTVDELGLEQKWDEFRNNCYRERAVSWCYSNGIEFREKRIETRKNAEKATRKAIKCG